MKIRTNAYAQPLLDGFDRQLVSVGVRVASMHGFDGIDAQSVKGLKQLSAWNAVVERVSQGGQAPCVLHGADRFLNGRFAVGDKSR